MGERDDLIRLIFSLVMFHDDQHVLHCSTLTQHQDMLGNLKQELLEEKDHLRIVRKRRPTQNPTDLHLRVLSDAVRNMFQDFKNIERGFLVVSHEHWEPYSNRIGYYDTEKGWAQNGRQGATGRWVRDRGWTDRDDFMNTRYKSVSLWDRMVWVRTRGAVIGIAESLGRVQTRRIARQVTGISG